MTESFRVPEPSEAAIEAYWCEREGQARIAVMLRAAYAVDVPAIVRAEVERWEEWKRNAMPEFRRRLREEGPLDAGIHPASPKSLQDYLSTRFPEAAPEPECPCGNPDKGGVHYLDHRSPCKPTPSAPAETRPITRKELVEGARNVRERAEERRSRVEPESCTACACARCIAEREFVRERMNNGSRK